MLSRPLNTVNRLKESAFKFKPIKRMDEFVESDATKAQIDEAWGKFKPNLEDLPVESGYSEIISSLRLFQLEITKEEFEEIYVEREEELTIGQLSDEIRKKSTKKESYTEIRERAPKLELITKPHVKERWYNFYSMLSKIEL
tara:strand:- start:1953 stop:2378 length:426 start_codon:yes stop_codon:yes gene_type:complete